MLQLASELGNLSLVELLLSLGADPNACGGRTYTALLSAILIAPRPEQIVRVILNHGADPNLRQDPLGSPLCAATSAKDEVTVQLLIEGGADADDGSLHVALQNGYLQLVTMLIRAGASLDKSDTAFENPLSAAVAYGVVAIQYLVEQWKADPNVTDGEGRTALHAAANIGTRETVEYLLTKGLDVDKQDLRGWSAIHYAALADSTTNLELLLPYWKCEPDEGWTPLRLACRYNKPKALDLLLAKSVQPTTLTTKTPPWTWTMFDIASTYRNRKLVSRDMTPLHVSLAHEAHASSQKVGSTKGDLHLKRRSASCEGCQPGAVSEAITLWI